MQARLVLKLRALLGKIPYATGHAVHTHQNTNAFIAGKLKDATVAADSIFKTAQRVLGRQRTSVCK